METIWDEGNKLFVLSFKTGNKVVLNTEETQEFEDWVLKRSHGGK